MHKKILEGISRNVVLLGLVSFLADASGEIVMPLLPLFIASLGGGGIAIGLIGGISDSISSFLRVISGYWSDKIGKRKPFVFAGYGITAVSRILLAFSTMWQHVLLLRPLDRFGKGLREAPRDAIISGSVSKEIQGKAFGIHRAMDSAGAIIGSIIAFALFWFLGLSFKTIFLIAGVIAFFALLPIFMVREPLFSKTTETLKTGITSLPKKFRIFLLVVAVFALGNFTYMFFILRAGEFFTGKMAIAVPLLLYVWFNVIYTTFSIPFGMIADKVGKRKIIVTGYSLFVLTSIGFAFVNSFAVLILLFALYGLFNAAIEGNQRAFASSLIGDMKGTGFGVFHTVLGFAALPSGIIAGVLWQYAGASATFIYGAVMGIAAILIFMFIKE